MKIEGITAQTVSSFKANMETASASTATNTDIAVNSKDGMDLGNIERLTDTEKLDLPISEQTVIKTIEKANDAISVSNKRFEYSIHEKTKAIMIKVIDTNTNKVIREIPPEKILDMVAKMCEMAGLFVDERR
jgi:flagellar protein FlaG